MWLLTVQNKVSLVQVKPRVYHETGSDLRFHLSMANNEVIPQCRKPSLLFIYYRSRVSPALTQGRIFLAQH
jgi:hypothetical protein